MADSLFLCMDVGGTKLDYRFVDSCGGAVGSGRLLCREFSNFSEALQTLIDGIKQQVDSVCIAAAGPVLHGSLSFTNLDWHIDQAKIKSGFAFKRVVLVNDLTAMMWGLGSFGAKSQRVIKPGSVSEGVKIIVAPGTGLGVGVGVEDATGLVCIPSEGGHISFSPRTVRERELLAFMAKRGEHVSAESVCSGRGLGALFRFLTADNPSAETLDDLALGPWLKQQVDNRTPYASVAVQTYQLFFDLLAEVCGNLAVTCLATGGVYLAGGLMDKLGPYMDKDRFIARFVDRSVQKGVLESMAIMQLHHANPALVGCQVLLQEGWNTTL